LLLENTAEATVPTRWAEVSLRSLKDMEENSGESLELTVADTGEEESSLLKNWTTSFHLHSPWNDFQSRIVKLHPRPPRVKVAAVDCSSRKIGRTKKGLVCAFRGTVVWRDDFAYRYLRYGPFLFHITERFPETFRDFAFSSTVSASAFSFLNPSGWLSRIRYLLEIELQRMVCESSRDSIILWDGVMPAAGLDLDPVSPYLSHILRLARSGNNKVMALAKETRLFSENGGPLPEATELPSPCLVDVDKCVGEVSPSSQRLGYTFIAKFAPDSPGFRLDVDRCLPKGEMVEAVERLLASDLTFQGYPETLRAAHILSALTPVDVLGLQRSLAGRYGFKIVRSPPVRRMLFGPYGGWDDS
jgi:hypothetical protein